MSSFPPTRMVWVRKEPARTREGQVGLHTQHEKDCRFLARRRRNGLDLAEQYDEVQADQVTVAIYECRHCSPTLTS